MYYKGLELNRKKVKNKAYNNYKEDVAFLWEVGQKFWYFSEIFHILYMHNHISFLLKI